MNREESQRRLAGRITMARTRAGMRQEDLAKRVGVSSTTVKSWESGRHAVASQNYSALARAFGISVSKLLEGIEDDNFDEDEWAIDVEVAALLRMVEHRRAEIARHAAEEGRHLETEPRQLAHALFELPVQPASLLPRTLDRILRLLERHRDRLRTLAELVHGHLFSGHRRPSLQRKRPPGEHADDSGGPESRRPRATLTVSEDGVLSSPTAETLRLRPAGWKASSEHPLGIVGEPPLELGHRDQLLTPTPDPAQLVRDVILEEVVADAERLGNLHRRQREPRNRRLRRTIAHRLRLRSRRSAAGRVRATGGLDGARDEVTR